MKRTIRTIAIAYTPHLRRSMAVMGALCALCLFLYGFFLLEAVAHTASRTHAQGDIQSYTSKLSSLEETYLSATRDMTLDRAHELGFVSPSTMATVYVSDPSHALSMRTR
jgi:hypothetical protein